MNKWLQRRFTIDCNAGHSGFKLRISRAENSIYACIRWALRTVAGSDKMYLHAAKYVETMVNY